MSERSDLVGQVTMLVNHAGVRSADRANMERILKVLRGGKALTYQDRANLWAYLTRYRAYLDTPPAARPRT